MFEGLDQAQLSGAIEAMLFVTDEPVGVIELADMLEADPKLRSSSALVDLREKLEREQRGIQLREVAGGWRLYTHPAYHDLVEKLRAVVGYAQAFASSHGNARHRGLPAALHARRRCQRARRELRQLHKLPGGEGVRSAKRVRPTRRATPRCTPPRAVSWRSSGCAR